jgi:hypothetical protein
MKIRTKLIGLGAVALALGVATYAFTALSEEAGPGFGPPFMRHAGRGMMGMGPGMLGIGQDAATTAQLRDIHRLFAAHDRIKRTVTTLPNGIRTITESDDPEIAQLIKTHVADMGQRVGASDDPGLPIESPALHSIFRNKDKIHTVMEPTANGVSVVQTSDDPSTVAALQEHASQVSDFVQNGMAALHTAMMKKAGGMMMGSVMHHGGMNPGAGRGPGTQGPL